MNVDLGQVAVEYATLGFRVFPVVIDARGRKLPLTPHGHLDAVDDPDRARELFAGKGAHAIGMVHDRLLVVDVDVKHGSPGKEMFLTIKHVLPEPLAIVSTPSGGRHYYYPPPTDRPHKRQTHVLPGIDILMGEKGWIGVPPSPGYEFIVGSMEAVAHALSGQA